MKNIYLPLFFLAAFLSNVYAQESLTENYNKFSIEAKVGFNKPSSNFSDGYFFADDETYLKLNTVSHFNLGVRYMFNDKFGLKFDGSYDILEPQKDTDSSSHNSLPFEARQYRFGLEAVMNLGNVLSFKAFTNRFGLLVHAGLQASRYNPQTRNGFDLSGLYEDNGGFVFGLSPQLKISDNISLTVDVTFIENLRQHLYWDGAYAPRSNNLESSMINTSVGLNFYLGRHEIHADWIDTSAKILFENQIAELEDKITSIDNNLKDSDKDGVPDYLDREPNTTSGVAVNSKGEAIDLNENGIPDELERNLESRYVTKEYADENNYSNSGIEDVKPDANDELINVYFKFNSTQPEFYSLNSIDRIVRYMKKYPETKAVLVGYTDQIGVEAYNLELSEERARKVYEIVIASGIDESRLSYLGGGVDETKNKNSSAARQLSRRVSFQLK